MLGLQKQAMKRMMSNPAENEQIRAYAGILAGLERDQREQMRQHAENLGVDPDEVGLAEPPDPEERVAELADAVGAHVVGDAWGLYVDHLAPDELENTDRAGEFAGVDADGWNAQIEEWAATFRDRAGNAVADRSDRDLADVHVRETFGVGLDTFESEVVEFEPGRVFQEVVAGPIETHTDALAALDREV
ncbi:hypothetical protein [Halorubrum sodomense]|uniref:Uncharacterized protein n=1 Tax=Halorubrum sodomense TaxID=35743 RepID=A0A1I6HYR8_HALSD|nr:hypothetical protein [Halorubrum sodomense]SFR59558.1 hypothetical protein SAMN04487937_2983 [Halorubrum sodomense]